MTTSAWLVGHLKAAADLNLFYAEIDDANLAEYPKVAGLDGLPPVGNSGGVPVTLLGSGATRHYGSGGLREVNIDTTSQATCEAAEPTAISRNLINFNNVICTGGPVRAPPSCIVSSLCCASSTVAYCFAAALYVLFFYLYCGLPLCSCFSAWCCSDGGFVQEGKASRCE